MNSLDVATQTNITTRMINLYETDFILWTEERAKRKVLRSYNVSLPEQCPYSFEDLMTRIDQ